MNQILNTRYTKRAYGSVSAAKTTPLHLKPTKKESVDCTQYGTFKYSKLLPKLDKNQRDYENKAINLSTDIRKINEPDRSIYERSQRRQIINFTRFSPENETGQQGPGNRFVAVTKQGKRPYNEDRYICKCKNSSLYPRKSISSKKQFYDLYAVFDGHGGYQCAQYLKDNFPIFLSRCKQLQTEPEQALRQTFQKAQQKFIGNCESKNIVDTSGSCAVVCLVMQDKIYVANLGDSRALMLSKQSMLELTKDHKPHQIAQKMRIIKHGGKIYREQEGLFKQFKIFRQMRITPGNLNVSRTFGDIQIKLKKYGGLPGMISSVPQIGTFDKGNYDVLLLGSDGLFEAFTNTQIQELYSKLLKETNPSTSKEKILSNFIEELSIQGQARSTDNVTIIGVLLN